MVSIPGLGRSPGEGHGNPLQYSWLENLIDKGAWWAKVLRITPGLGTEHLPGALCSGTGSPALGLRSPYEGEFSLPHVLAQGSPIFHSSFNGELGIAPRVTAGQNRPHLGLCPHDPMNRSTPGLPIHHQLLEFTQTHVH